MRLRLLGPLLVLCLAVASSSAAAAAAEQEGSLLTSPSRLLASVAPGGTTTVTLTIRNNANAPAAVAISAADLAPGRDEYSRLADAGSEERGAGTWLRPERETAYLLDGQQQEVDIVIRVPRDARPGGHYGAVVVEQVERGAGDVGIAIRLVTHVTVIVPGAIEYGAQVRALRVPDWARDSVTVRFRVHNTGGIHVRPVARIVLRGPRGAHRDREVEVRELLPGGVRDVRVRMPLPALAGRFRATVDVRLEDRTRSEAARARFWGARSSMLWGAGAVLSVLLLLAGTWRIRRWIELRRYMREEFDALDEGDDAVDSEN